MNGMGYDLGMIYITNILRMRNVDKNFKVVNTVNVDKVVY